MASDISNEKHMKHCSLRIFLTFKMVYLGFSLCEKSFYYNYIMDLHLIRWSPVLLWKEQDVVIVLSKIYYEVPFAT